MSTQTVDPTLDRHECQACGYVYDPIKGDDTRDIPPGVPFESLNENWRCPVCGARSSRFSNLGTDGSASGFKENLKYGFGNTMTPDQKNLLIFGGLFLAFLFFISLYGLQ